MIVFPHDQAGLARAIDRLASRGGSPRFLKAVGRPSGLLARSWKLLRRVVKGGSSSPAPEEAFQRVLDEVERESRSNPKPLLVIVATNDISKMQSGGGRRVQGIARVLSSEYNVQLVVPTACGNPAIHQTFGPDCHLIGLPVTPEYIAKLKTLRGVRGAGLFNFIDAFDELPQFKSILEKQAEKAAVWGVISPIAWPIVERVCRPGHAVYYDAHDDYSLFLQNCFGCQDARLVARMESLEKAVLERALVAAYCTPSDLESACRRFPGACSHGVCIPNGVDVRATPFAPPGQARSACRSWRFGIKHVAVFVGAHHVPNVEAVKWIVQDFAPACPSVLFVVVGVQLNGYLESGGQAPGANVVFTGPVDEETKEAVFALSEIALAPMKTGTGSSLKIPEYVAHGKVVVGTPVGLRGFEDLLAFDSVVADEDVRGALGRVLERLDRDPDSYTEPCRRAREWVTEHLDWSVAAKPLVDALAKAVAGR